MLDGILALMADEREHRIQGDRTAEKTEVVLARAGLSIEQIAAALGKNYDAVRKTIARARAG
jgi:DNA-directed RNA polymerase specialized sigma24 family protein